MPPPKLHLNEHISWRIAEQLRKLGFDVTSTLELGMVDEDDDNWGIILSTEESVPVLRRRLLRLLNTVSADELKNQMRWLNEFK